MQIEADPRGHFNLQSRISNPINLLSLQIGIDRCRSGRRRLQSAISNLKLNWSCTLPRSWRKRRLSQRRIQDNQRHIQGSTYRCFLPDLTGFVDLHCIGPELSGIYDNQIFLGRAPQSGIQPCWSGLQVQGTAGSPLSTTKIVCAFIAT